MAFDHQRISKPYLKQIQVNYWLCGCILLPHNFISIFKHHVYFNKVNIAISNQRTIHSLKKIQVNNGLDSFALLNLLT